MRALSVGVNRMRLALEGSHTYRIGATGTFTPALPTAAAGRVEAEIGYGVSALGDRLLTPYSALLMADDGSRDYRVGSRLQLDGPLALSLEVGRREAAGRADDHRVLLQLQVRP